jgi:hypothetical protein
MGNPASAPPAVAFCRWFLGPSPQNEIILDGIIWVIYIINGIYMEYMEYYMEYIILDGIIWNIPTYIWNIYGIYIYIIEGSLEVKLPTIWRDEKQSRAEAQRRGRLEERR